MRKRKKESCLAKSLNSFITLALALFLVMCLRLWGANISTVKFAQISDVHFSTDLINKSYRMTADSKDLIADAVKQINNTPNIDFVVFTGDMVNKPFKKELDAFLPYASMLKYKWYPVLGNHDVCLGGFISKSKLLEFLRKNNPNFDFEKTYYAFYPKKDFKCIVLDTIIDTRLTSNGEIDATQLKWLDNELKKAQDKIILIFMHVPIIEPMNSPSHRLINSKEVLAVLDKYDMPIAVFSGHYHTTKITQRNNTLHISTPALISYPNAFRIVEVLNKKTKVVFNIEFNETGLKDVQRRAKIMVFHGDTYHGTTKDQTVVYELKKR